MLSLHDAVRGGEVETVRTLLRGNPDLHQQDARGFSPLGVAIDARRLEVARLLLEAGADPDAPARNAMTALIAASLAGFDELVPALLRAGAAVDHAHPDMGGVLCAATIGGHRHTVEALLRAGATSVRSASGSSALHFAAYLGQLDLVELFLALPGFELELRTFVGGTPLRAAAAQGHLEVVKRLLELGANPGPVDAFDRRPVDDARDAGHQAVVALLEDAPPVTARAQRWADRGPLALVLPERSDATLRGVVEGLRRKDAVLHSACSSLEAPSVLAVIRVLQPDFQFECHLDTDPDPRLPARPVKHQLWTYRRLLGLAPDARPAVPAPPPGVEAVVWRLAAYPYHLSTWSRLAGDVASSLGASALPGVLATMAHWCPGPTYLEPWDWRFRTQVAAALIASHLGGGAVEDVAEGPADWASSAAIIALLDVARRDAGARPAALATLHRCARRRFNPTLFQHVVFPGLCALADLGCLEPDEERLLRQSEE